MSDLLASLVSAGKVGIARALSQLEREPESDHSLTLLDAAFIQPRAHVLGVTGPPGVGKSTLISALIQHYRVRDETVAVIAVDPSSKRSGGALLGDRTRFDIDPDDGGSFVRSMAARDKLGGLAQEARAAIVLLRAVFDRLIVETVGVGQSETAIEHSADTVLFAAQPGSGDSLQFMKAGIVEIPDIAVITKADMGTLAERARRDLRSAIEMAPNEGTGWSVPVLAVSATDQIGLEALVKAIDDHRAWLEKADRLASRRLRQAQTWLTDAVTEQWGSRGLAKLQRDPAALSLPSGVSSFRRLAQLARSLEPSSVSGSSETFIHAGT
ncbi:MAG: ArgK/MeaB family GTPase [Geminicoccaceae bacterium]